MSAGSSWRYQENGKKPSKSWAKPSYSDKGWKHGKGQLGFGEGDEKTVLKSGEKKRKPITTYFRTSFKAKDVSKVEGLRLEALVDDGAAVYLNGHRIWLTNLPTASLTYKTKALTPDRRGGRGDLVPGRPARQAAPQGQELAGRGGPPAAGRLDRPVVRPRPGDPVRTVAGTGAGPRGVG